MTASIPGGRHAQWNAMNDPTTNITRPKNLSRSGNGCGVDVEAEQLTNSKSPLNIFLAAKR
jgi:hypothetical protein